MVYPENGWAHRAGEFDHLRAYLHSRTLRWSFGPMRGSEGERRLCETAALPPAELVAELTRAGFGGIYLDRYAFPNGSAGLEAEFAELLRTEPLVSPDRRLVFFRMADYGPGRDNVMRQGKAAPVTEELEEP
jgi:phosphoglycerol transferase